MCPMTTLDYAPRDRPPRDRRRPMPWLFKVTLAIALFVAAASVVPVHLLYARSVQFDIRTGRRLTTTRLLGRTVSQAVSETPFSLALTPTDKAVPADWQPIGCVRVYGSFGFRPRLELTTWGSAASDARELEEIWSLGPFTPEARRASALRLLSLWQAGGDPTAGKEFLARIGDLVPAARPIGLQDLPDPPPFASGPDEPTHDRQNIP